MNWSCVGGRISGTPARMVSQRQQGKPAARAAPKASHRLGALAGSTLAMKREPGSSDRLPPSIGVQCCKVGAVTATPGDALRRGGPADSDAHRRLTRIAQGDLGAQDEQGEAPLHRLEQEARQQQLEMIAGDAPDDEVGQHPALGRAPRRQLRVSRRQRGDVVGQLPLEKGGGIAACDGQGGQRAEVADDGGIACRGQFARRVAEGSDLGRIKRRAAREQKSSPGSQRRWGGAKRVDAWPVLAKTVLKSSVSLVWRVSAVMPKRA